MPAFDMGKSLDAALGGAVKAKSDDVMGEADDQASGTVAMQDFIAAVQAGDAREAWDAFRSLHELCNASDYDGKPLGDKE